MVPSSLFFSLFLSFFVLFVLVILFGVCVCVCVCVCGTGSDVICDESSLTGESEGKKKNNLACNVGVSE